MWGRGEYHTVGGVIGPEEEVEEMVEEEKVEEGVEGTSTSTKCERQLCTRQPNVLVLDGNKKRRNERRKGKELGRRLQL